jgi:hypothetical protein
MELDLQSLFGLYEHSCTHCLNPRKAATLPPPPHLGSYKRALLVNQNRRHLLVTPCRASYLSFWHLLDLCFSSVLTCSKFGERKNLPVVAYLNYLLCSHLSFLSLKETAHDMDWAFVDIHVHALDRPQRVADGLYWSSSNFFKKLTHFIRLM